jgi:hypothetical protein
VYGRNNFKHSPRNSSPSQLTQNSDFLCCLFSHTCARLHPQPLSFDIVPQNTRGRTGHSVSPSGTVCWPRRFRYNADSRSLRFACRAKARRLRTAIPRADRLRRTVPTKARKGEKEPKRPASEAAATQSGKWLISPREGQMRAGLPRS